MSDLDPLDIRAQEKLETERKATAQHTERQEIEDFKWLMADPRGRRFMWNLLDKTGIYRTSFTGNSTTFFNEGARNIGLVYMGMINDYCMERYTLMLKEQRDDNPKRNTGNTDTRNIK